MKETAFATVAVWFLLVIGSVIGWVMNLIALVHSLGDPITGIFILRCIGLVVVPLGVIFGYVL